MTTKYKLCVYTPSYYVICPLFAQVYKIKSNIIIQAEECKYSNYYYYYDDYYLDR